MCWIGRKNTKQVAKRDFYVYKIGLVIGNTFTSLFQKYIYRIKRNNPIIPLKSVEDNCGMIKIEDGYHSYKEVAISFCKNTYLKDIYLGDAIKGFIDDLSLYSSLYLGTFIVPKGAIYCVNELNEIVSNQIIYTGQYSNVWRLFDTNLKESFNSI